MLTTFASFNYTTLTVKKFYKIEQRLHTKKLIGMMNYALKENTDLIWNKLYLEGFSQAQSKPEMI